MIVLVRFASGRTANLEPGFGVDPTRDYCAPNHWVPGAHRQTDWSIWLSESCLKCQAGPNYSNWSATCKINSWGLLSFQYYCSLRHEINNNMCYCLAVGIELEFIFGLFGTWLECIHWPWLKQTGDRAIFHRFGNGSLPSFVRCYNNNLVCIVAMAFSCKTMK